MREQETPSQAAWRAAIWSSVASALGMVLGIVTAWRRCTLWIDVSGLMWKVEAFAECGALQMFCGFLALRWFYGGGRLAENPMRRCAVWLIVFNAFSFFGTYFWER